MPKPLVSVLIATYNMEQYIEETINSVLAQDYQPIQIVVVDDGSSDNTREVLSKYGERIEYYHQAASGGPSAPRNLGLTKTKGEYIAFFDADDIMKPDRLSTTLKFMQENPQVGALFTDYCCFTEKGTNSYSHFSTCERLNKIIHDKPHVILSPDEAPIHLLKENFAACGSMMIRSDVIKTIGNFNINIGGGEDFEFYYRIAKNYPIAAINTIGFLYRLHNASITANKTNLFGHYINGLPIILSRENNSECIKVLRKKILVAHIDRAYEYSTMGMPGKSYKDLYSSIFYLSSFNTKLLSFALKLSVRNLLALTGLK